MPHSITYLVIDSGMETKLKLATWEVVLHALFECV